MAKSYHLKEIIELEAASPYWKSLQNFVWNQFKSKHSKVPFMRHPLDEMAIWNTALQLDKSLIDASGRGQ